MRNLITFLIKNASWFFFVFLEVICFYFIFQYNAYQRSVFLNSSSELVGRVYVVSGNVQSFFGLRKSNDELLAKNAELQLQVWQLQNQVHTLRSDTLHISTFVSDSLPASNYQLIKASVNNLSINQIDNYLSINKGSKDGIENDMGVISQRGIVGTVRAVSPNFAYIMPILNSKSRLTCRVKRLNITGTLIWDGASYKYANLENLSGGGNFMIGDTIVTDYSHFFRKGIMVGLIVDFKKHKADNFYSLKIKLATDYSSLADVLVIKDLHKGEMMKLEEEVTNVK